MKENDPQLNESLGIVRDGAKCTGRIIEADKTKEKQEAEEKKKKMRAMFPEKTLENIRKANEEKTKETEEMENVI